MDRDRETLKYSGYTIEAHGLRYVTSDITPSRLSLEHPPTVPQPKSVGFKIWGLENQLNRVFTNLLRSK
jgi:hypothetical protein